MKTDKEMSFADAIRTLNSISKYLIDPAISRDALSKFSEMYSFAFDYVDHPDYGLLERSCVITFDIMMNKIRHESLDELVEMACSYMNFLPLNEERLGRVLYILDNHKFEFVDNKRKLSIYNSIAYNINRFSVFESILEKIENEPLIFSSDVVCQSSEIRTKVKDIAYLLSETSGEDAFNMLVSPVFNHILKSVMQGKKYSVSALALQGIISSIKQNNIDKIELNGLRWIKENIETVTSCLKSSKWDYLYHKFKALEWDDLGFPEISAHYQARGGVVSITGLLEIRDKFGIEPDAECIDIYTGKYSEEIWEIERDKISALVAYAMVHEIEIGNVFKLSGNEHPLEFLLYVRRTLNGLRIEINNDAFEKLVDIFIPMLNLNHDLSKIDSAIEFRGLLNKSSHYNGLKLEQSLGL